MKKITVPILNNEYGVHVIWGDPQKMISFVNRTFGEDYSLADIERMRGRCFHRYGVYPVILINNKDHFWATLAHESIHAVGYIWYDIGEKAKDEVFAHSVGAIVFAVEKYVKRLTLKPKEKE